MVTSGVRRRGVSRASGHPLCIRKSLSTNIYIYITPKDDDDTRVTCGICIASAQTRNLLLGGPGGGETWSRMGQYAREMVDVSRDETS
jgi:hypothetical protein